MSFYENTLRKQREKDRERERKYFSNSAQANKHCETQSSGGGRCKDRELFELTINYGIETVASIKTITECFHPGRTCEYEAYFRL